MQINRYTDYAYRVLMYLAINNQRRVTMAEIASYYSISHEHLRKVVHQLSSLQYIKTYTGKGGGMELGKPTEDINIGQLFIEFEGIDPLIDCEKQHCPLRISCSLSHLFSNAQMVFLNEIKQSTLKDLLDDVGMKKVLFTS